MLGDFSGAAEPQRRTTPGLLSWSILQTLTTAQQCGSLCVVTFVLLAVFHLSEAVLLLKREFLLLVICCSIYSKKTPHSL